MVVSLDFILMHTVEAVSTSDIYAKDILVSGDHEEHRLGKFSRVPTPSLNNSVNSQFLAQVCVKLIWACECRQVETLIFFSSLWFPLSLTPSLTDV